MSGTRSPFVHASHVTRREALRIFDLLYSKAWHGMGGNHVLGSTREALRKAYSGCLIGGYAPHFWLEMPLAGEPHCDLHVSYDYAEVVLGARFAPGSGFGYQGLYDWFCVAGTRQTGIDFTFDLSDSDIEGVGAYVSFHNVDELDIGGFCSALGCPDDVERCRRMAQVFPKGWRPWYMSPFPSRTGNPLRAAALASDELRRRFAGNPSLVRDHLRHVGISSIPDELCQQVSELSTLPITLEWRVAMDGNAMMRDHCDVSFYLSHTYMSGDCVRRCFGEDGVGTRALGLFEQWGAADSRWRDVVAGSYASRGPFKLDDGTPRTLVGICSPSCFMLPWEKGRPLPAKVYPKMEAFLVDRASNT